MLCVLMLFFSVSLCAITIEEMSEKNNKIIELDQEIAIAEKNKKLADLKNATNQPEIFALPKIGYEQRDDHISVLSVHGVPDKPIVDVQYGEMLLQKRIGEFLPGGWEISAVGNTTVTFTKKIAHKPQVIKTVSIGNFSTPTSSETMPSREPVPIQPLMGQ